MATVLRKYAGADLAKLQDSDDNLKLSDTVSVEPVPSLGAPIDEKSRGFFWRRNRCDPDAVATQPSVFDDPATLEVYRPPPVYESAHRFDPLARWTWKEELVSAFAGKPGARKLTSHFSLSCVRWTCTSWFGRGSCSSPWTWTARIYHKPTQTISFKT